MAETEMVYCFERVPAIRNPRRNLSALGEARVHSLAAEDWRQVQIFVEQPAAIASEYVLVMERPDT
jgi:hypothetical protein